MIGDRPDPPALPTRVLIWALPPGVDGLTILGDVLEEFRERARRDGIRAARRWYWWHALTLGVRIAGNPDRLRRLIAQSISDLRLARRSMSRAPALVLAIVIIIGLAVGANTALFSVFDGLLFRPLPYQDADRIVHVALNPGARAALSEDDLDEALARAGRTPSLTHRAVARPATLLDRAGVAVTDWGLRTYQFSASTFDLLGVQPVLGRRFAPEDRLASGSYDVLITHDLWQSRFGGDSRIVGRVIQIPGTAPDQRWQIVGVMPRGFSFPEGANVWVPDYRRWAEPDVAPYARLASGVTLASVRAELPHFTITPLREHVRPRGASALGLLLAGTTLMLLVAWVQVAALLFARATDRTAEIGVRLALGATRARLMRQFTIEGAGLILLALGLAALMAPALTAWIVSVLPADMTVGQHVSPDLRAFLFAAGVSAVGLIGLTLLPVDLIRRSSPNALLRGSAGATVRRSTRVRTALFAGQLAIATSLVYLTGLAAHSLVNVSEAELGFVAADLYAIRMPRGDSQFAGTSRARSDQRRKVVADTIETLRRLPGVRGVTGANSWPMQQDGLSDATFVPDADPVQTPMTVRRGSILPGYPGVLGTSLLAGTEPTQTALARITREAREKDRWYALVNQTLARQLERFGPVVGQVLNGRYQISGVMPDVALERVDRRIEPTILLYLPPVADVNVVLMRLEPGRGVEQTGVPAVLDELWRAPSPRPFPVTEAVALAASDYRARTLLLGLVAMLTVPLTMLGVAGALTYTMRQRAREIAIELAIGADPRDLSRRLIRRTMTAAAAAVAIGLALGIGAGRLLSTALFGVQAADPTALAVSIALVLFVAWVAALIPARRAGRVGLTTGLREA
jgi:putative ABC transport system permease protein